MTNPNFELLNYMADYIASSLMPFTPKNDPDTVGLCSEWLEYERPDFSCEGDIFFFEHYHAGDYVTPHSVDYEVIEYRITNAWLGEDELSQRAIQVLNDLVNANF